MLLGKGDPNNGGFIYGLINEQYWWPYTYAEIHRLSAFYNRTLRAWASHMATAHRHRRADAWQPQL